MNISNCKILVTGASGFVGSHLVEKLLQKGYSVKCFIRYNSKYDIGFLNEIDTQLFNELEIIRGDLRDYHAIKDAMKCIDIVFHLGALIAIPYSFMNPKDVIDTNVLGTLNILNSTRDLSIDKIIHTSTSEVYGTAKYIPMDENHPLQAQSPYAASKISADKLAESYYCSYNLPISTIRPFNIYGPRQSARAVIPTIISQALTQKHIKLGNLTPTRDFTYVSDTVEAFIKIAESDNTTGKVYNIGSTKEISIGEIAKKICKLTNIKYDIIYEEIRERPKKSEVERLCSDSSKAMDEIKWKPKVLLEDGLIKTIHWSQNNIHCYNTKEFII